MPEKFSLYLMIILLTLFVPLIRSFESQIKYIKKWKYVFISSLCTAIFFIYWDIKFTQNGYWGFNPDYLIGLNVLGLPLEEVLFFFVVPFSCIFLYETFLLYVGKFGFNFILGTSDQSKIHSQVSKKSIQLSAFLNPLFFTVYCIALEIYWKYMPKQSYTKFVLLGLVILWSLFQFKFFNKSFKKYLIVYLIFLVPFYLVNGVLTGSITPEPIVWYNEVRFSGVRVGTIPLEDHLYMFLHLISTIMIYDFLKTKKRIF